MTKSNGIASLKQAAKLLNKHAPEGESLAYINPDEGRLLKAHGGSGIQTLSGVPTYGLDFWNWNWFGDEGIVDKAGDIFGYGKQTVLNKKGEEVEVSGRSPFQDAISVYAFLRAKKDQEGLNAAEQSEFNRLNQQLTAGRKEFKDYSGGGEHLTSLQNVPETIEDVSVFKETTGRPDMITTGQAQGGRIGYDEGTHPLDGAAIQMFGMTFENLNPLQQIVVSQSQSKAQGGRIGYNLGGIDRPFQGIGALNPRMGYQNAGEVENFNWGGPDVVETANIREEALFNNPLFDRDIQALEKEQTGEFDEIVRQDLMKRVMKYIRDAGGSYKVPERSYWEALSKATEAGDEDVIEYLSQSLYGYPKRVAKQEMPMGAAYGGRIGAEKGGIMPLLDMGGMEKDYRQDGGFVPIGRKEKADDVPARLSKNEFVFTADAVRAAGGGDIDQGAQRMYNVMKNLEAGGQISQQSQGKA